MAPSKYDLRDMGARFRTSFNDFADREENCATSTVFSMLKTSYQQVMDEAHKDPHLRTSQEQVDRVVEKSIALAKWSLYLATVFQCGANVVATNLHPERERDATT